MERCNAPATEQPKRQAVPSSAAVVTQSTANKLVGDLVWANIKIGAGPIDGVWGSSASLG